MVTITSVGSYVLRCIFLWECLLIRHDAKKGEEFGEECDTPLDLSIGRQNHEEFHLIPQMAD